MARLLYFLRSALSGIRQSPFIHAVAALTIGVALLATGLARFGLLASARVLDTWGEDVELTLYLADAVTAEQAEALVAALVEESGAEARYVSADEAMRRLRQDLGEAGDVLADLPRNPLPGSIEIRPASGQGGAQAVQALAERWSKRPEVESVDYGREWVERLEQLTHHGRNVGLIVFLAVVIAAVTVAAATLQLGIYARREEIEIQKLVGATDAFVRAPFLIEGAIQGLFGAALAVGALLAMELYLGPAFASAFGFVASSLGDLQLVDLTTAGALALMGMLLGFVGSLLAVGRFLRV